MDAVVLLLYFYFFYFILFITKQYKTEVEKELLERNYDIETIRTWFEYID